MTTAAIDVFEANRRLNDEEIAQGRTVLSSWPRELMVILTSRCNLECIMCTREVSNKLLPEETAFKVAALFPYLENVDWQGGEAFSVPYFGKLIAAAARFPQLQQWVTTSGVMIDRDWADLLVRSRMALSLSIDGVTRETYEHIRRGSRFDRLLRSLDHLNEASERHGLRPRRMLNATIMRSNAREIEGFVDFAKRHRFNGVTFSPVLYIEDEENIFHHQDAEALAYLAEASPRVHARAAQLGLEMTWLLPAGAPARPAAVSTTPAPARRLLCKKPWKKLHINAISDGGNAYPECFCPGPTYAGNLLTDSLESIWNSPVMQEYRSRLLRGDMRGFCSDACVSGRVDPAILSA